MPEKQREPERSTDYWNGFEDGQAAATAQPVPPCGHCGHLDGHAINCDAPSPVLTPAQITIGVPTIETFNESLPGTMRPEATFVKSERPVLTQPSAEPSALQKLAQEGIAYKRECIRLQGIIDKLKAERPVLPVPPTRDQQQEAASNWLKKFEVSPYQIADEPKEEWAYHLLPDQLEKALADYAEQARASSPAVAPTIANEPTTGEPRGTCAIAPTRAHFDCHSPTWKPLAPAVAGRTQGDELAGFKEWAKSTGDYTSLVNGELVETWVVDDYPIWQAALKWAALRESASLHNLSESETKAAKIKLYDLWCQAGSEDFTQWLAEKAIELFAGARLTHTGGNND